MITARRAHPGRRTTSAAAVPASLLALSLLASACVEQPERLTGPIEPQAAKVATNCATRSNDNPLKLTECVTLDGVRAHQVMLRNIANAHYDSRAAGTGGYDASAAYVANLLAGAGYDVTLQPFQFTGYVLNRPSVLEQTWPMPTGAIENEVLQYSGSGDVTAGVTVLPAAADGDATPGCEAADFTAFPVGHIALIERGGCNFSVKAANAYNAGGSGVVVYNNVDGAINGTLGFDFALDIPAVSVTRAEGLRLANTPFLELRVMVDAINGTVNTWNVIAETSAGDPGKVVMIGATLDSGDDSPGVNGNGSGVAAVLETAVQMARVKPRNQVRFAFWGGYFGTDHYLNSLSEEARAAIALYIDAFVLASPNYALFVMGGDPPADAALADLFGSFYARRGFPSEITATLGPAAGRFALAQIPFGGITTGGTTLKTPDQQLAFGGLAGEPFDPCYYEECDNLFNTSLPALDLNGDAIATAAITFAMGTGSGGGKDKNKPNAPAAVVTGGVLADR